MRVRGFEPPQALSHRISDFTSSPKGEGNVGRTLVLLNLKSCPFDHSGTLA